MVSASSISDPIIQLIASLALAFVLYAASFPSVMDTLTAGTITVVFSSMIALMRPLKSLTNVNAQFQRGMAACQTLFAILDSEQEKDEGTRVIERAKGNLKFENVTFTYPGREVPRCAISISISRKGKPWRWWGAQGRVIDHCQPDHPLLRCRRGADPCWMATTCASTS